MIIPIAIDLSEHDSIPEYKHDSADFMQLSRMLSNYPFVLLHDSPTIRQSCFFDMIDRLPQKSRSAFIQICKKIPYRAVPDWDGMIVPTELPALNDVARVLAMSKAKFHLIFGYEEDTYVANHPKHETLECALWKALEQTQAFEHSQLLNVPIKQGDTRSTLWSERFEPIIRANKWSRIKLVDRYIFSGKPLDFSAVDFLLTNINKHLTHPTEIEVFLQTDVYQKPGVNNKPGVNQFPNIVSHLGNTLTTLPQINELRIYAYNKKIGQSTFHDRFLFLASPQGTLYTYNIGKGFTTLKHQKITDYSEFSLKVHYTITDQHNKLYKEITNLTPNTSTITPDYKANNVKIYRIP